MANAGRIHEGSMRIARQAGLIFIGGFTVDTYEKQPVKDMNVVADKLNTTSSLKPRSRRK
jgi:hypothetical protein